MTFTYLKKSNTGRVENTDVEDEKEKISFRWTIQEKFHSIGFELDLRLYGEERSSQWIKETRLEKRWLGIKLPIGEF